MTAFEASITWADGMGLHHDRLILPEAALQADARLIQAGRQLAQIDAVELDAQPWLQPCGEARVELPAASWRLRVPPVPGRFYPRLAFDGLGVGVRDLRPCRLLEIRSEGFVIEPNHPLAGHRPVLRLRRCDATPARTRFVQLFDGPGMQSPPEHPSRCYLPEGALARQDESEDRDFYAQPRLVQHLDAACRAEITRLYGRFLQPGHNVLDLMSSWVSHLPESPRDVAVCGLGMNAQELAANPRLTERIVHDLNREPHLPFAAATFDLVICTASVEYLTRPQSVFAEVRRVLKSGGRFVLSFSDRWFPTKAIKVWAELHPFERLGLVLWLLHEAGFSDLHSETLRGLKRPEDDPHIGERDFSDPLFAAWGTA